MIHEEHVVAPHLLRWLREHQVSTRTQESSERLQELRRRCDVLEHRDRAHEIAGVSLQGVRARLPHWTSVTLRFRHRSGAELDARHIGPRHLRGERLDQQSGGRANLEDVRRVPQSIDADEIGNPVREDAAARYGSLRGVEHVLGECRAIVGLVNGGRGRIEPACITDQTAAFALDLLQRARQHDAIGTHCAAGVRIDYRRPCVAAAQVADAGVSDHPMLQRRRRSRPRAQRRSCRNRCRCRAWPDGRPS